jgi:thioredoxin-related protein
MKKPSTAPMEIGPPIVLYFFAMMGCEYCERAKKEVVPKLQASGIYVQTVVDAFEAHKICGFKPKMYPTWMLTVGGKKIAVFEGLVAAKMLGQAYDRLKASL